MVGPPRVSLHPFGEVSAFYGKYVYSSPFLHWGTFGGSACFLGPLVFKPKWGITMVETAFLGSFGTISGGGPRPPWVSASIKSILLSVFSCWIRSAASSWIRAWRNAYSASGWFVLLSRLPEGTDIWVQLLVRWWRKSLPILDCIDCSAPLPRGFLLPWLSGTWEGGSRWLFSWLVGAPGAHTSSSSVPCSYHRLVDFSHRDGIFPITAVLPS